MVVHALSVTIDLYGGRMLRPMGFRLYLTLNHIIDIIVPPVSKVGAIVSNCAFEVLHVALILSIFITQPSICPHLVYVCV
jgi:hypothetical protein